MEIRENSKSLIELRSIVESLGGKIKNALYSENNNLQEIIIQCGNKFDYYPHEDHPEYLISVRSFKYKYKTLKSLFCPYCARPLVVKSEHDRKRLWTALNRYVESLGGLIKEPLKYIDNKTRYLIKHGETTFYSTPRQLLGLKTYKPEHGRRISASSGKRIHIDYNDIQRVCENKQIKLITSQKEFLTSLDYENRSIKRDGPDGRIALTPKQISLKVIYKNLPFEVPLSDMMRPEYLPYPRRQLSEELCRSVFEFMFKTKFIKQRPKWLQNSETGRNLELDGYAVIDSHKIAFEHDGFYHNNEKTKILDLYKDKKCETYGVKLFRVPELFSKTQFWDLPKLILNNAKNMGIDGLIKQKSVTSEQLKEIYLSMSIPKDENIKLEIKKLAEKNNINVISYRSAKTLGDIGRLYVKLQNKSGTRQKAYRASEVIQNINLVLEHFNDSNKRDLVPNQKVKNVKTGQIFDSMAEAARSIGKPPSYLQVRLKIDKKLNRIRVKNETPFILL
jgi:hypothetical protein